MIPGGHEIAASFACAILFFSTLSCIVYSLINWNNESHIGKVERSEKSWSKGDINFKKEPLTEKAS